METEQYVFSIIEKAVIIPDEFTIESLRKKFSKTYQSISDSARDELFSNQYYSGTATFRIVPAVGLTKDGKPLFVPGESDPLATLAALHDIILNKVHTLNELGYYAIVIPFASKAELHGQKVYLMLTHHKLTSKELPHIDCGWRLGITFDWATSNRLAETGIAFIDIPY